MIDWQPVQIAHFCPESKPLAFFALTYPSNPSNFPLQSCISNLNHNQSGKKVIHLVHIKQTYLSLWVMKTNNAHIGGKKPLPKEKQMSSLISAAEAPLGMLYMSCNWNNIHFKQMPVALIKLQALLMQIIFAQYRRWHQLGQSGARPGALMKGWGYM